MLQSIIELQAAVAKSVKRSFEQDIADVCFEGSDEWVKEQLRLESCNIESLLSAKDGGDIYAKPRVVYSHLVKCLNDINIMMDWKKEDSIRYAALTGNDLFKVLERKAKGIKIQVRDSNICTPLQSLKRGMRYSYATQYEKGQQDLAKVLGQLKSLNAKELKKCAPAIEQAKQELAELYTQIELLDAEITELFQEAQRIEAEHSYTYVNKKRVYDKSTEFNKNWSSTIKESRTTLSEYKKYSNMFGIDDVIPKSLVEAVTSQVGA